MRKKHLITIAFVVATFILIGIPFLLFGNRPDSPRKVTIAQFGDLLLYMPLYIANDTGLFSKNGLDVKIVSTGGDEKTYAAVLSGSAQFGVADPTFVAIAHERGQPGKVIALLIDGVPNYGVAISPQADHIKTASALKGKTVATVPAPSTSYALIRKLYQSAGLEPSIHQIAPSGLVPSLKAGQADYALLIEPWVSAVVRDGGSVAFSLMDYYRHFALTGVTTSTDLLNKSPDIAIRLLEALIEATRIFYNDPARTLQIARQRFSGERPEDLEKGLDRMRRDRIYPQNLQMTQDAWDPAVNLRREIGDLERAPASMNVYVDTETISRAKANVPHER